MLSVQEWVGLVFSLRIGETRYQVTFKMGSTGVGHFKRTQVNFPRPYVATIVCNTSHRGYSALFWPQMTGGGGGRIRWIKVSEFEISLVSRMNSRPGKTPQCNPI